MSRVNKYKRLIKQVFLRNPVRTAHIAFLRKRLLERSLKPGCNHVIVFLSPGHDLVNGGIMSIVSIADESSKLFRNRNVDVYVCTHINDPGLLKYTKFTNFVDLHSFFMVLRSYPKGSNFLINIPDIYVDDFVHDYIPAIARCTNNFRFNVLLQNYNRMPDRSAIRKIQGLGEVTVTTAHKAYSNRKTEELLSSRVYHLSVWIDPRDYHWLPYDRKESLILLSPDMTRDNNTTRKWVIDNLMRELPGYKFETIQNLTYSEYKEKISRSRFTITFGEGLDGYYIETIFSGGIGCAVFNNDFFTDDFRGAPFLYATWEELVQSFPHDLNVCENSSKYSETCKTLNRLLANHYSSDSFQSNISNFYRSIGWYR